MDPTNNLAVSILASTAVLTGIGTFFFNQHQQTMESIEDNLRDIAESSRIARQTHVDIVKNDLPLKETYDNMLRTLIHNDQKVFAKKLLDEWNNNFDDKLE